MQFVSLIKASNCLHISGRSLFCYAVRQDSSLLGCDAVLLRKGFPTVPGEGVYIIFKNSSTKADGTLKPDDEGDRFLRNFNVLLTVHLIIISVTDQLNAQILVL